MDLQEISDFYKKRFILETLPPRGVVLEKYVDFCIKAVESGAEIIAVTDLPMGSARVSPIAPAHILVEKGIDVIMHFSRTTRNAIRIEGDLIASHMLGIKNLLILSGDDPRVGTYPFSSCIEDFSIYDVFKLVKLLNEKGEDLAGLKIFGKFSFNSGGVFSPFEKDYKQTIQRMNTKIETGCLFFVSQPVFNESTILNFLKKAEGDLNETKIYVSLMVFESVQQLEYFSKVPGVFVPKEYFHQKDDRALKNYSYKNCLGIIEKLSPYVQGFYLTSTTKDLEIIKGLAEVIQGAD
ncbi:methylenetetrahydrofolate reductase [Fervidobacterium nodosum]|uniref:Methylenetetrahydrofolate reductase n=1 Tax=Fervidobacterium nodosum (strain ATCC 35602 / DSM 5306 / Rt17-B1) TaxID=381764 RepID=A7HND8_FERNB|nr:methylenetetrahydrofolate reductase [Fervidobacterium nodosum]ABS61421.1 methylenetetrahydrofolate reductase [Fervidobacterium nodosum Rt17-B1]